MREWFRGERFIVFLAETGRREAPVDEFLQAMAQESSRVRSSAARVRATIEKFANAGKIRNSEQFKPIGEKVVEFKHHQIRIFGVTAGRLDGRGCLYLTHAIKKKKTGSVGDIKSATWDKLRTDPDWKEEG